MNPLDLPFIDPHIPKYQRDFIDQLARYEGTTGIRFRLREKPLFQQDVEKLRRHVLPTLKLKPLPASHNRGPQWSGGQNATA
jgi:hypothetical protein